MVGLVLVSHSHALATAVKELVVAMTGPSLPIAIAAGAGDQHADLGTNGVEIMEAITSVMSDEGVLVLMDLGSALLSTDTALEFLDEAQRARVRCSAAPFIEGAVAAGVSATLGSSVDEVNREALGALKQKREHLGSDTAPAATDLVETNEGAETVRVTVPNPHGLHARPAARFVREAAAFNATIQVRNISQNRGPVSAKSLTGLGSLGILRGHEIEISAVGLDVTKALQALKAAVESGLGDSLTESPQAKPESKSAQAPGAPVGVSSGLAMGPLLLAAEAQIEVPAEPAQDADAELKKLHAAIATAKAAVAKEQAALRSTVGKNEAEIFAAQGLVLEDPALLEAAEKSIREDQANAAFAWAQAYQTVADDYTRLDDEYLRQRATDVRDVGSRVLAALGIAQARFGTLTEPGLLVVDDLTPAEVTALPKTVLGVICRQGGRTSHAAILLRARGIPAIASAGSVLNGQSLDGHTTAAFDGETGELWLNPDLDRLDSLRLRLKAEQQTAEAAARLAHEPAITTDGHTVGIFANLGHASEAAAALERGAEGVGLFRTEFLFLDRAAAPDEEEQFTALRPLCETMGQRPVIVRTLDIGGDKEAPYLDLPREANPFLGERGIRLCLPRPELFQPHLRAILRAGHGGDFRIMFPMVTELSELRAARAALEEAHCTLETEGIPHAWPVPTGVMIEVPSAAVLSEQLAAEADFFSIGTNDLTQYVLAADRGNPALAHYQDALHPAVLRLIAQVIIAAHRFGKHVGVCGEAAGDGSAARLLTGLGIDELSLSAARIPATKAGIRQMAKSDLALLARNALEKSSTDLVREAFRDPLIRE